MSEFIRRTRPSLKTFTELIRCQTPDDYRPNKALIPASLAQQCRGFPKLDELLAIASEGVRVHLRETPPRQTRFPRNHPSASARLGVLRKNVRKEQDLLRCLVVDADIIRIWPEIIVSPFGIVDKGSGDPRIAGRTIHDLSFPEDGSVNHYTDPASIPKATFEHCSAIAREITRCKKNDPDCVVKVMAGDVAAAYRNACIHSESVHLFGGHIPEVNAIVIDLSAAFGWSGSSGNYGVLGGAVAYVHGSSTDAGHPSGFFSYHWVDDHVNVAADSGPRCAVIERSLRFSMTSILGPAAVNEEKFTPWRTRQQVLGLIFDTVARTVAMPSAKVAKAQRRICDALQASSITRSEFRSLIGSLRHVATCIRPAQAFLQRLRSGEVRLLRHSRVPITTAMRDDLTWWWRILHDPALNGVPLEYFGELPEPDIVVSTDASDVGLCALVPALRLALTYRFSQPEHDQIEAFKRGTPNEFDINYRELLACAFALHAWAPSWRATPRRSRPLHVHFRVDNTSAIAWQTKMASRNSRAQVLIRLLSLWEQEFDLRISASHIPGVDNTAADAGSRRWENATYARKFSDSMHNWQHTPPPAERRRPRGHLAQHLREHSVADSSFKKYALSFERWKQWTGRRGVSWQLNLSTDRQIALISEFIIDHTQGHNGHQRPVRGATMKTTLCGIRHFFTAAGLAFPSDHPQIRMLLKGVGRLDAPRRSKAPVSVALLEECANALDLDDPADQALWGVLCLAFFFMLRRSEISATTSTSFKWFALKAADISTVDASGTPTIDPMLVSAVCIRLIGSKTNQGGAPTTRMLARSGHPILCPVLGALLLLRARTGLPASIPAAVFTGKDGTPGCVAAAKVSRTIQRAARDLGEDPARFSSHSLRAGGATSMYRAGVDSLTIQFHGRWASDAFKLYTRLCQESVSSVAARIVSGPRASTTLA